MRNAFRKLPIFLAMIAGTLTLHATQASATQVCAWMRETLGADSEYDFDLWMQSDSHLDFFYKIGGKGIVTGGFTGNSPSSATYSLNPNAPEKVWGFGGTLEPPGKIDFVVEIHQTPADIFSDAPTRLLAEFFFQRNVPASEKHPPQTLAQKQCATVKDVP